MYSATSFIRFIAFCAIIAIQHRLPLFVIANIDGNDGSFSGNVNLFDNHHSATDDVEMLPNSYLQNSEIGFDNVQTINGNVSIGSGNRSGKLYQYDEYMGSVDEYPGDDGYDYGEKFFLQFFYFNFVFIFIFIHSRSDFQHIIKTHQHSFSFNFIRFHNVFFFFSSLIEKAPDLTHFPNSSLQFIRYFFVFPNRKQTKFSYLNSGLASFTKLYFDKIM